MPEGHSIKHFANVHMKYFGNTKVRVSSPQGRFEKESSLIDGSTFLEPRTHGKHLFLRFDDRAVHVHLGLYGWFKLDKEQQSTARDTVRMRIQNDVCTSELTAPTKCELVNDEQIKSIISKLGPDPLHEGADCAPAWDKIRKSNKSIASLMMNQSVIAGIGNVYRAEILHRCQINPHTLGKDMSKTKFEEIWQDAVYLLAVGATDGRIRTVTHDFLSDDERRAGRYTQFSYVYKRTGQPCRICKTTVEEAPVDGRTLYWCPKCQA